MNKKERNLQSFREALVVLQRQVDELDGLKAGHYAEIVEHEEEVWDVVQGKMCLVVRSTLDVYDKFTSKASDPVIEPMLQSVPDPFDSYGPPQSEDQIFSILPPLSIMPNAPSSTSTTTPVTRTPELENSLPSASSITSWSHSPNAVVFPSESSEWADLPPSPIPISPRSSSPTASTTRRHNSAPVRPASPRKAESKLRRVLSAIDESNSRLTEGLPSHAAPQMSSSNSNGPLIQPQPQKRPSFSWTSPFSYGHSPYDEEGESTPRNSTFLIPQAPTMHSDSDLISEDKTDTSNSSSETMNVPVLS